MSFTVRPPAPGELRRIPAFLPRWQQSAADEFLVAEAEKPRRIVAMAALKSSGAKGKSIPLDLGVLPRFRASEVIPRLITPLLDKASAVGAWVSLVSPQRKDSLGPFLQLGFQQRHQLVSYEFSVREFAARTKAAWDRLARRGSIPAGAQVVSLSSKLWPAVVRLLRTERLVPSSMEERMTREGVKLRLSPPSAVLLLNGQVKGAVIAQGFGRRVETQALTVVPELRGGLGWAHALLTARGTQIGHALGYEVVAMSAEMVKHPMTTRLAARMRSEVISDLIFLDRP